MIDQPQAASRGLGHDDDDSFWWNERQFWRIGRMGSIQLPIFNPFNAPLHWHYIGFITASKRVSKLYTTQMQAKPTFLPALNSVQLCKSFCLCVQWKFIILDSIFNFLLSCYFFCSIWCIILSRSTIWYFFFLKS